MAKHKIKYYISLQDLELKKMYADSVKYPIAVKEEASFSILSYRKNEIRHLKGCLPQNVFIRIYNGTPELWVNIKYSGYRKAFKIFLRQYYSVRNLPSFYHIDHSLARCIAHQNHLQYVRLFLIPSYFNIRQGSLVEKKMKKLIEGRDVYTADMYTYFKLFRIVFPKNIDIFYHNFRDIVNEFRKHTDESSTNVASSLYVMLRLWNEYFCDKEYFTKDRVLQTVKKIGYAMMEEYPNFTERYGYL